MTVLTATAIEEIKARDRMIRELREALAQHKMWLGDALDREAVLLSRIARAMPRDTDLLMIGPAESPFAEPAGAPRP